MNPNTLAELKALHKSIGDLILAQEADDTHQKLKSLIGRCYLRSSKMGIVADRITSVSISHNWESQKRVHIHRERVECSQSEGETTSLIDNQDLHYSVQEALSMVEGRHLYWKDCDIIRESKFAHLKAVIENRSARLIDDVMEVSAE